MVKEHVWSTDQASVDIMLAVCRAEGVDYFLEVGTCVGSTAYQFAEAGFMVRTCDIQDQRDPLVVGHPRIEFVLGGVEALLKLPAPPVVNPVRAAFIDGDHSAIGVFNDFQKLERAGVTLFFLHDCYGIPEVRNFVDAMWAREDLEVIKIHTLHKEQFPNGLAIIKRR